VAFKSISLYSKSSGQIDQIVALKGSRVKKGDVLIRIKNEDQAQKLEQAKALALQRQMEYKAAQELTHKSFSSEISLAGAKTALESALAGFATAQQNYNNLFITAPFDGIFNSTDLDEGSSAVSFLTFGSAIGSMIDLSSIKVVLQIPEKDALGLKVGNEAFLSLPYIYAKDMEKGIRGKITYVSQAADPKLRTFRAEILAPNPDTSLYEGMTVEAKIPVKSLDAHLVNFSILTLNDKGDVGVKAVDEQGKVIFYPVTPLKTEKEKLWVEGLPSNCNIISMGQDFVTAGQKVDVSRKGK
jgi:multidrug efflux system membrane fusion protein